MMHKWRSGANAHIHIVGQHSEKKKTREHEPHKKVDPFYFSRVCVCVCVFFLFKFLIFPISSSGRVRAQARARASNPLNKNKNLGKCIMYVCEYVLNRKIRGESERNVLLASYLGGLSHSFGCIAMQLESTFHLYEFTLEADQFDAFLFLFYYYYCPQLPCSAELSMCAEHQLHTAVVTPRTCGGQQIMPE